MRENPRPQEIYRHFKGNLYQILSLAEHTETGETLVIYQALYGDFKVYARELSMFLRETDKENIPKENIPKESVQNELNEKTEEADKEWKMDPLVLEFLDAGSYEERLNILAAMQGGITDEMINTMAVSVDLEIKEGSVEERYDALKNCLLTLEKYECNRLR